MTGMEMFHLTRTNLAKSLISTKTPLFGKAIAQNRANQMKSIMVTYPGFQSLPKGLKQMLVESERFFFEEETTFIRRDGKPPSPFLQDMHRLAVRPKVSQSWNN
jgi:hypothetical protein